MQRRGSRAQRRTRLLAVVVDDQDDVRHGHAAIRSLSGTTIILSPFLSSRHCHHSALSRSTLSVYNTPEMMPERSSSRVPKGKQTF